MTLQVIVFMQIKYIDMDLIIKKMIMRLKDKEIGRIME